jgi:hypothetical protein
MDNKHLKKIGCGKIRQDVILKTNENVRMRQEEKKTYFWNNEDNHEGEVCTVCFTILGK